MTMRDFYLIIHQYTKSLKADFQHRVIFKTTYYLITGFHERFTRIIHLCKQLMVVACPTLLGRAMNLDNLLLDPYSEITQRPWMYYYTSHTVIISTY